MIVLMKPWPSGCDGCSAACCRTPGGATPWDDSEKVSLERVFPADFVVEEKHYPSKVAAMQCRHVLDDGRCFIQVTYGYAAKPIVCRDGILLGSELCLSARREVGHVD